MRMFSGLVLVFDTPFWRANYDVTARRSGSLWPWPSSFSWSRKIFAIPSVFAICSVHSPSGIPLNTSYHVFALGDEIRLIEVVEIILNKSKIGILRKNWKKFGKIWKNMEKFGKIWKKFGKNLEKFGKIWKKFGKNLEKFEKILKNWEKIWKNFGKNLGKIWKNWEKWIILYKQKKVVWFVNLFPISALVDAHFLCVAVRLERIYLLTCLWISSKSLHHDG